MVHPVRFAFVPCALALLIAVSADAAELRGTMLEAGTKKGPKNAEIVVECPCESPDPQKVSGDGTYSVRGIPSGARRTLQVKVGEKHSKPIDFTADRPVVRINGEVRVLENKVIVLRR